MMAKRFCLFFNLLVLTAFLSSTSTFSKRCFAISLYPFSIAINKIAFAIYTKMSFKSEATIEKEISQLTSLISFIHADVCASNVVSETAFVEVYKNSEH